MEDIYGDLENYNEVNALEELQSENRELKGKLDEYSTAMDKLQKDFDKLSSEYKKLECNYSSLLKTAQAEIERKTKIIKDLNIEKDLLVINSLKNGNKRVLNIRNLAFRCQYSGKHEKPNTYPQKTSRPKATKSTEEIKEVNYKKDLSPILKTKISSTGSTDGNVSRDVSESKENVTHAVESEKSSQKPLHIRNRRKSMPTERFEEDLDGHMSEQYRRKAPETVIANKNAQDINYNDRYNRTSEQIYKNEMYYEPSRDTYRSRSSKHYDNGNYKGKDKYDSSRRRRFYSPETRNRYPREYRDDHYNRIDHRDRKLENTPVEYQKDYRKTNKIYPHDYDRYKWDRQAVKHKIPTNDYDEPYSKKQRNEAYQSYKRQEVEEKRRYEKEYKEHQDIAETFEELQSQYTSCQSPDFDYNIDYTEPIKEIMNTAVVQLEDPRISSSNYELKTLEGKEFLSTKTDIKIKFKVIKQSDWGVEKVSMPEELIRCPSDEQLIKELYTDFDNPVTRISMDNEPHEDNVDRETETNQCRDGKTVCSETKKKKTPEMKIKNLTMSQPASNNYNVSKVKEVNMDSTPHTSSAIQEQGKSLGILENLHAIKDGNKNYKEKIKIHEFPIRPIEKEEDRKSKIDSFNELEFTCGFMNTSKSFNQTTVIGIVEGDLELSDETCDNMEDQKVSLHDKKDYQAESIIENVQSSEKLVAEKPGTDLNATIDFVGEKLEEREDKNVTAKENVEVLSNITKKEKPKKKKQKDGNETYNNSEVHNTEKTKCKSKAKPKQIKTKFHDLFGDSTSLITPEDLGLITNKTQVQNSTNYVPIFEDATDGIELQEANKIAVENLNEVSIEGLNKMTTETMEFNKIEIMSNEPEKAIANLIAMPTTETCDSNENINLHPTENESDVVKTVIISTGVQPIVLTDVLESIEPFPTNNQGTVVEKNSGTLLNALATSTPYKSAQILSDPAPIVTENSVNSNNSESMNTATVLETSGSETVSQKDVPDVRIFLKRKRKIIKK